MHLKAVISRDVTRTLMEKKAECVKCEHNTSLCKRGKIELPGNGLRDEVIDHWLRYLLLLNFSFSKMKGYSLFMVAY